MEYLLVHFPRSRQVLIDDEFNGRTNELIELEAGRHTVSLGPPYDNYEPTNIPSFSKTRLPWIRAR